MAAWWANFVEAGVAAQLYIREVFLREEELVYMTSVLPKDRLFLAQEELGIAAEPCAFEAPLV